MLLFPWERSNLTLERSYLFAYRAVIGFARAAYEAVEHAGFADTSATQHVGSFDGAHNVGDGVELPAVSDFCSSSATRSYDTKRFVCSASRVSAR